MTQQISTYLKTYFDPQDGHFNDRVKRLVGKNGELEELIRTQVHGDDSLLAKTLTTHVGQHSPLMKSLDPSAADGVIQAPYHCGGESPG